MVPRACRGPLSGVSQRLSVGHVGPKKAVNVAQYNIIGLLKTRLFCNFFLSHHLMKPFSGMKLVDGHAVLQGQKLNTPGHLIF